MTTERGDQQPPNKDDELVQQAETEARVAGRQVASRQQIAADIVRYLEQLATPCRRQLYTMTGRAAAFAPEGRARSTHVRKWPFCGIGGDWGEGDPRASVAGSRRCFASATAPGGGRRPPPR